MRTDFSYIFQWWALLFLIGVVFLPVTATIFKTFFDRGYIFSKIVGFAIFSYIVFILGIIHLLPFTQYTVIAVLIICAFVNCFVLFKTKQFTRIKEAKHLILLFIFEEVVFFGALRYWAYIRAFTPSIHELEK